VSRSIDGYLPGELGVYMAWLGPQEVEVNGLGLRRWGHAEFLRQEASATLVDA
jgi:hypothetical protein